MRDYTNSMSSKSNYELAEKIYYSQSWKDIIEILNFVTANKVYQPQWELDVFVSLCQQLLNEFTRLKLSFYRETDDHSAMAWHSRNLLEIFVWINYCLAKPEYARRFYEDAGRDGAEVLDKFVKWGATNADDNWINKASDSLERLKLRAIEQGIDNVTTRYLPVKDAANAINFDDYLIMNKFLSKFAHPTAQMIISSIKNINILEFKSAFYGIGACLFLEGFNKMQKKMVSLVENF